MTVDFYTKVAHPQVFSIQLILKIYRSGQRVLVLLDDEAAVRTFGRLLCHAQPTGFIPYCLLDDAAMSLTPVVLTHAVPDGFDAQRPSVWLNLSHATDRVHALSALAAKSTSMRVLEIVGQDAASLQEARMRYKAYEHYFGKSAMTHHDCAALG